MKRLTKLIVSLLLIGLISLAGAFGVACTKQPTGDQTPPPEYADQVKLNVSNIDMLLGDKQTIKVKNAYELPAITWESANESIAKVDDNGTVEGYGIGTTTITASAGEISASCTINVGLGNTLPQLMIKNEHLDGYNVGLGNTAFPFEASVFFNGKTFDDVQIELISEDQSILTVDNQNDTLSAVQVGQTQITVMGSWRGLNFDVCPSFLRVLNVSVVNNVCFYVNNRQYTQIDLFMTESFLGKTYEVNMPFNPTVVINGTTYDQITVEYPDVLTATDGEIASNKHGTGKIYLKYYDAVTEKEYTHVIDANVIRPEETYGSTIKYFTSHVGTYRDQDDGYIDKSLVNLLFGTAQVENLKAYQDKTELTVKDGKVLGVKPSKEKYEASIRFETDQVIYNVNVMSYSLIIQNPEDLKLFEVKDKGDGTYNYVQGYCELFNSIDADGIKIEHSALSGTPSDIASLISANKMGFAGVFNGNGYTISNLDLSAESSSNPGVGLFGNTDYATIQDVGFINMNISNGSGLAHMIDGVYPYAPFKNIYIELSEDTVNPLGAIAYKARDVWGGKFDFSNIIIDATGVSTVDSYSGLLTADGSTLASLYCTRNKIYIIGDAQMSANYTTYTSLKIDGVNGKIAPSNYMPAGETPIEVKVGSTIYNRVDDTYYLSGIYQYSDISELKGKNFEGFSESWEMVGWPIFRTAFEIIPELDGDRVYTNTIAVSSTTEQKQLNFILASTNEYTNVELADYDKDKIEIDGEGKIKLVQPITEEQETTITVNYQIKDKQKSLTLKVRLMPEFIDVSDAITMSALTGTINLEKYLEAGDEIKKAWQVIDENEKELTVKDGAMTGAKVVIKSDNSDVETTTIKIKTKVTIYRLTNVKVYSHVISKAVDLKVFERKAGMTETKGFYIMTNNVDATGVSIDHDTSILKAGEDVNVFQGVFDGRGYSIISLKPNIGGLFGQVYSSAQTKTIIRNVGFIDVQSVKDKNFTIFGQFIHTSGEDGAKTEISNVHVSISKTFRGGAYPYGPNYKGLFESNSGEWSGVDYDNANYFANYKMTNVFVEIIEEDFTEVVTLSGGTLLSRDHLLWSKKYSQELSSSRFENVVTIAKTRPIVYRQWVGDKLADQWGIHMYNVYAENEVGTKGLAYSAVLGEQGSAITYPHEPVAENPTNGSFVLNNVYRYEDKSAVDDARETLFTTTGYWVNTLSGLKWKSAPYIAEADDETQNFKPGWLETIN